MTSARTARRLTRILSMMPWVIGHPGATVDEVCARFGYTAAELTADLNLIFVCGLPGYGPGDLMDAYIDGDEVVVDMADYFAASPRLAPAEALALLASGMALLSTGLGTPELASGVEKLQRALLPEGDQALAVELATEPGFAAPLRDAARQGRVMEITYTGLASGETTRRAVEPHAVFSAMGNWYLSAHCRLAGGQRVFRVDRIRALAETDDRFPPPAEPPEPTVRYTPSEDDVHALIRLGPRARWVADYYPVDVIDDDGEEMLVHFAASDPRVAARVVVRLGDAGELVEGTEVAEAVRVLRDRIAARYSG